MRFKLHHTDPVKKNSVRYDEIVAANGTALVGNLYMPKTTLLKLTGGKENWPAEFEMADVLALEKPSPAKAQPAPVSNLRRRAS